MKETMEITGIDFFAEEDFDPDYKFINVHLRSNGNDRKTREQSRVIGYTYDYWENLAGEYTAFKIHNAQLAIDNKFIDFPDFGRFDYVKYGLNYRNMSLRDILTDMFANDNEKYNEHIRQRRLKYKLWREKELQKAK